MLVIRGAYIRGGLYSGFYGISSPNISPQMCLRMTKSPGLIFGILRNVLGILGFQDWYFFGRSIYTNLLLISCIMIGAK